MAEIYENRNATRLTTGIGPSLALNNIARNDAFREQNLIETLVISHFQNRPPY